MNSMEQIPSYEANNLTTAQEMFSLLMKYEVPYSEPDESSQHLLIVFVTCPC
jgi:hypothetical protein